MIPEELRKTIIINVATERSRERKSKSVTKNLNEKYVGNENNRSLYLGPFDGNVHSFASELYVTKDVTSCQRTNRPR